MTVIKNINELMTTIENGKYNYYGLRGASENDINNISRGYLDCSYDWVDNEITDEQLNGTCAIGVNEYLSEDELENRYNRAKDNYAACNGTTTVLLIADDHQEYGNDEDEVILGSDGYGAYVVAVIDL